MCHEKPFIRKFQYSHNKMLRQINFNSLVISRNFCKKCIRVNFRIFHTVPFVLSTIYICIFCVFPPHNLRAYNSYEMRLCLIPISQAAGSIADYSDLYFAGIEHSIHEINMILLRQQACFYSLHANTCTYSKAMN